jgi:hypothetical protein
LLKGQSAIDLNLIENRAFFQIENDVLASGNLHVFPCNRYFSAGPGLGITPESLSGFDDDLSDGDEARAYASVGLHYYLGSAGVLSIDKIVDLSNGGVIVEHIGTGLKQGCVI